MFFSKNLKYLRKKENLNQKELGQKLKLTRDSIASLENERMNPSLEILINIKYFFNINLDDLIFKDLEKEEV